MALKIPTRDLSNKIFVYLYEDSHTERKHSLMIISQKQPFYLNEHLGTNLGLLLRQETAECGFRRAYTLTHFCIITPLSVVQNAVLRNGSISMDDML